MKRTVSLLICVLMICMAVMASCGTETGENSKPEQVSETKSEEASNAAESSGTEGEPSKDPYVDASGKYVSVNLPEFNSDWNEYKTFTVLVYSNKVQTTYFSEEIESLYDTTDEKIFTAVNDRNDEIESKYGIKIKALAVDNVNDTLKTAISGGSEDFDAAMPFMSNCAVFAQEGSLYDLNDLSEYIDLNAPWWDANANEALSVANKLYFSTGDISLMQKIVSGGIAFNKKLMRDSFQDVDMYQIVRDGEWTVDKYYTMAKEFTHAGSDGAEKMDENDYWGSMGAGIGLYYGAGEKLCKKDTNDIPFMYIGQSERSVTVAQKVMSYLEEKGTWYITADDFTDQVSINKWDRTVKIFGEDQALFYTFAFSALKKFRNYDVVYGILPIPKYDTEQDEYFSNCSIRSAYGVCIPYCVKDPEFSAYMLELLAIGGKNYITDAYYSSVLKGKDANTEDDEDMLDIIFSNIVYDVAGVYNFNGLADIFSKSTSNTIASTIDSMKDSVAEAIETVVDDFLG